MTYERDDSLAELGMCYHIMFDNAEFNEFVDKYSFNDLFIEIRQDLTVARTYCYFAIDGKRQFFGPVHHLYVNQKQFDFLYEHF